MAMEDNKCLPCGLIFAKKEDVIDWPVPLTSVKVDVSVVDFVAQVKIEQAYVNRESAPIEVIYMFPIEEEAAVVDFEAVLDDRTIKTKVSRKKDATKEYETAIEDHKTAVLFEETTPDIFRIKLGQLRPEAKALIRITYICELPVDDKSVRLTVPTTIAPRYVPPTDKSQEVKEIAAIRYSEQSPAPLSFHVDMTMKSRITAVKSPSHQIKTDLKSEADSRGMFGAKCQLETETTELNKDIVVLIQVDDPHKPVVFVEQSEDAQSYAAMVSLVPTFKLTDQKTELIFLIDRSGSMQGSSMKQAIAAADLFLHSLPVDCYFNIFSFGSTFDSLFKGSVRYDDSSLAQAKAHVQAMEANYGGTEIYEPLEAIFKESLKKGYLRQVFVLTDGEVANALSVIQLVKKNASGARVFGLGLGASASRHLVKGIARVGGGTAVFAAEDEDLRVKVMNQLKNALQPTVSQINIDWDDESGGNGVTKTLKSFLNCLSPSKGDAKTVMFSPYGQAPAVIPPIYDGSRLLVFYLFGEIDKDVEIPKSVKITAVTPDGPVDHQVPIRSLEFLKGNFVHQMAARKRIQDLEEFVVGEQGVTEENIDEAVVKLALKYRLASRHTSFLGIDDKDGHELSMAMLTREIRNQIPSGFGVQGVPCMMAMSCPPANSMLRSAPMMAYCAESSCMDDFEGSMEPPKDIDLQDDMSQVINLQASDGHFKYGAILDTILGSTESDINKACPSKVKPDYWVTALCVQILQAMPDKKDLWELVVNKAIKYLQKNLDKDVFQSVMAEAKTKLPSSPKA